MTDERKAVDVLVTAPREPTQVMIEEGARSIRCDIELGRRPQANTLQRAARNAYVTMIGAREEPQTTHAEGCYAWGPKHYECAMAKIEALEHTAPAEVVVTDEHWLIIDRMLLDAYLSGRHGKSVDMLEMRKKYQSLTAALSVGRKEGWQPIEAAPRDGTRILADTPLGVMVVWRSVDDDYWVDDYVQLNGSTPSKPKFWMPLPAAPTAVSGVEKADD